MPAADPHRTSDVAPVARLTSIAALVAAVGGALIWVVAPETVASDAVAAAGVALSGLAAVVYWLLPWERLGRRWLFVPLVVLGVPAVSVACANTGGIESPYNLFFAFVPVAAAHFATRRELVLILLASALAAVAPLGYDGFSDLAAVRWAFTVTVAASLALVFQRAQETVRITDTRLRDLAMRDPLTAVANRRAVEEQAAREISRAERGGTGLSVCYLDLDGFKDVNDTLGHAGGDRALVMAAAAIAGAVRDGDLVGRIGGDEFAALLPAASADEADAVEARIKSACERALLTAEGLPGVSVSVGRATYPEDGATWEELLQVADRRLLDAKRAPRRLPPTPRLAERLRS
jgi:diguanylate cyclase (GGDEF)-like protein